MFYMQKYVDLGLSNDFVIYNFLKQANVPDF